MNGNPLYHWIGLAVASVLMLPISIAMLAGWAPPRLRNSPAAGLRLRAYAFLCFYGLVPANSIPRLADASYTTVMPCMALGVALMPVAGVLFILAERWDRSARQPSQLWSS